MGKAIDVIVPVGFKQADYDKLTAKNPDIAALFSRMVAVLARGGVLLDPEWVERIQTAIGTTDVPAIVEAVEKSVGRQGEAVVVPWIVDPTQVAFYQGLADNQGITLAHQLKTVMDFAYANGWLGYGAPDAHKILLTPEQFRFLQGLFQKDIPTGEDVINALQTGDGAAFVQGEEEDALLGSLTEEPV